MAEAPNVAGAIAARVRDGRLDRRWTLDEMAQRCGVSRRMLVNIEQGSTNPSIATLLRIAEALGVGLPWLVDVVRPPALLVTRGGTAPTLWEGSSGGRGVLVAGSEGPDVIELWDWTLAPGERHESTAHSEGTHELILVLEGRVELTVGTSAEVLATGDSASFAGDLPHAYAHVEPAEGSARFVLTVLQPRHRSVRTMTTTRERGRGSSASSAS
ncbi:helix-turn-helix domain-containing protein [Embleya sp. NPDC001921]